MPPPGSRSLPNTCRSSRGREDSTSRPLLPPPPVTSRPPLSTRSRRESRTFEMASWWMRSFSSADTGSRSARFTWRCRWSWPTSATPGSCRHAGSDPIGSRTVIGMSHARSRRSCTLTRRCRVSDGGHPFLVNGTPWFSSVIGCSPPRSASTDPLRSRVPAYRFGRRRALWGSKSRTRQRLSLRARGGPEGVGWVLFCAHGRTSLPGWRNGRRGGLKILWALARVGSIPTPGIAGHHRP